MKRRDVVALALVVTMAIVAGCGSNEQHGPTPATVVPVDCSKSMEGDSKAWPDEISLLASETLAKLGRVVVGCFAGPTRTVDWTTRVSAWSLPATGDNTVEDRKDYGRAYGRALMKKFSLELQPRLGVHGTNWLGAVQASLEEPDVHRIYLFSDLVQQAEGIDVTRRLDRAQIRDLARPWAKRLSGLRHVRLYVIASGQGVHRTDAADRGRLLLDDIGELVGFTPKYFGSVPEPADV